MVPFILVDQWNEREKKNLNYSVQQIAGEYMLLYSEKMCIPVSVNILV